MTSRYARVIHAHTADRKAYAFAFAFDDVGNHESLVHDGNPLQARLTLDPFSWAGNLRVEWRRRRNSRARRP